MRIATFHTKDGGRRIGLQGAYGLLDVVAAARIAGKTHSQLDLLARIPGVRALLETGEAGMAALRVLDGLGASPELAEAMIAPGAARLEPPVPELDKFFCVGKNSRAHLEELKRNDLIKEIPSEPTGFIKLNCILSGHDDAVERPEGITTLDYEPEIVFVIGKPSYRVSAEKALDHCAGVTLLNDLTAREIQKREVVSGGRFWTSKNMPGFGPVGPYIVTLDELKDPLDLEISCSVNGQERLRYKSSDQIYGIAEALAHFSYYVPFYPGDMISLGSPGGVAVGQANAQDLYLKPGDSVEVSLDGIMTLRTHIAAPRPA
jgi:2-keto-4-pentenoate hydratase/2-oxohepta-3-ene-1,7-dioic acid hydratase in catechol pathway